MSGSSTAQSEWAGSSPDTTSGGQRGLRGKLVLTGHWNFEHTGSYISQGTFPPSLHIFPFWAILGFEPSTHWSPTGWPTRLDDILASDILVWQRGLDFQSFRWEEGVLQGRIFQLKCGSSTKAQFPEQFLRTADNQIIPIYSRQIFPEDTDHYSSDFLKTDISRGATRQIFKRIGEIDPAR